MTTIPDETLCRWIPRVDVCLLLIGPVLFVFLGGCAPRFDQNPDSLLRRWGLSADRETVAGRIHSTRPPAELGFRGLMAKLEPPRVLFVGEQHDNPHSHAAQFRIIRRLHERGLSLAIGFELFRHDEQPLLDRWLEQPPSDTAPRDRQPMPFRTRLMNYYRDILTYARANDLPLVALTPPPRTVEKNRRNRTPDRPDKNSADPQVVLLKDQFHRHVPTGHGFDSFLWVQRFWESSMAETIHRHLTESNVDVMVVLTGNYHVAYDFGLPDDVSRLGLWSHTTILTLPVNSPFRTVMIDPLEGLADLVTPADYIWWTKPPCPQTPESPDGHRKESGSRPDSSSINA